MILRIFHQGKELGMINYPIVPRLHELIALPSQRLYRVIKVTYDFRTDNNEIVTLIVEPFSAELP
jgi:hypothetical protein